MCVAAQLLQDASIACLAAVVGSGLKLFFLEFYVEMFLGSWSPK